MAFKPKKCEKCGALYAGGSGRTRYCEGCATAKRIAREPRTCTVCGTRFVGYRNRMACSAACRRRIKVNESYFGGRLFEAEGWRDKICQLCGRHTPKRAHVHHVFSHPNHDALVVLCAGCHDEISKLAMRRQWGDAEFRLLISYVMCQRSGHGRWIVSVKTEELDDEEWESWTALIESGSAR